MGMILNTLSIKKMDQNIDFGSVCLVCVYVVMMIAWFIFVSGGAELQARSPTDDLRK